MPYHRHHRRQRVGLPESVVLGLLFLSAGCAVLWWQAEQVDEWRQTTGRVLSCTIETTHYNATDYAHRVDLTYSYTAAGVPLVGEWAGFWPQGESPNALPNDRIEELTDKGRTVVVLYHPNDITNTRLHNVPVGIKRVYVAGAVGFLVSLLLYCGVVYPKWKASRLP